MPATIYDLLYVGVKMVLGRLNYRHAAGYKSQTRLALVALS